MPQLDVGEFAAFYVVALMIAVQLISGVGIFVKRRRVSLILRSESRNRFKSAIVLWIVLAIVSLIYGFVASRP